MQPNMHARALENKESTKAEHARALENKESTKAEHARALENNESASAELDRCEAELDRCEAERARVVNEAVRLLSTADEAVRLLLRDITERTMDMNNKADAAVAKSRSRQVKSTWAAAVEAAKAVWLHATA